MSNPDPRLPASPSLEQLRKRAKELLQAFRAGDVTAVERFAVWIPRAAGPDRPPAALADAQFVLAREHGFDDWAALARHIERTNPPGLRRYELLAAEVARAYSDGDFTAIRELNWTYGTSYMWERTPEVMQQRLRTWYASSDRTFDLALADAKEMVARQHGHEDWDALVANLARLAPSPGRSAHHDDETPFYRVVARENAIEVRGPIDERQWDTVLAVMKERGLTTLRSGGQMTDGAMERLARADQLTRIELENVAGVSDTGVRHLANLSRLRELDLSGWRSTITDRGLEALRYLTELRKVELCWPQRVTDAGVANLQFCPHLESVNLMGTSTGDDAIRALVGKPNLRVLHTGRLVTDEGLRLLHQFPAFTRWEGREPRFDLMSFAGGPTHVLIDGPFTDDGLAGLVGLDGLSSLSRFWHASRCTPAGLAPLAQLPNLAFLGWEGALCNDLAMRHIGAMPNLRMLQAQGTVATDAGFEALSQSTSLEYLWGRECPNLTGRGFRSLARMPALAGIALSCKGVDDDALATLPAFPALRALMPMDVPDAGFRHVGRCTKLERLWCMYCRDTTDAATAQLTALASLKTYYAGMTLITDRSLEILSRLSTLEEVVLSNTAAVTSAGVRLLARLPRLKRLALDTLPLVTREVTAAFADQVRVSFDG